MEMKQGVSKRAKMSSDDTSGSVWAGYSRKEIEACLYRYEREAGDTNVPDDFVTPYQHWPAAGLPLGAGSDYIVHANHAISFQINGQDQSFPPEFTHQFFLVGSGEDAGGVGGEGREPGDDGGGDGDDDGGAGGGLQEIMLGYMNPTIEIELTSSCRFYVKASADHCLPQFIEAGGEAGGEAGRQPSAANDDAGVAVVADRGSHMGQPMDACARELVERIRLGLPEPESQWTTDRAVFSEWVAADRNSHPLGNRVGSWMLPDHESGLDTPSVFEVYYSTMDDEATRALLSRLQAMAMWYINGASLVDVTSTRSVLLP